MTSTGSGCGRCRTSAWRKTKRLAACARIWATCQLALWKSPDHAIALHVNGTNVLATKCAESAAILADQVEMLLHGERAATTYLHPTDRSRLATMPLAQPLWLTSATNGDCRLHRHDYALDALYTKEGRLLEAGEQFEPVVKDIQAAVAQLGVETAPLLLHQLQLHLSALELPRAAEQQLPGSPSPPAQTAPLRQRQAGPAACPPCGVRPAHGRGGTGGGRRRSLALAAW
ncbi:hypothetical protein JKP88DRAFT_246079 [Tribonema minus]|uniref:Uncharacterized protein n=1 Tax=Tribonema minus TaxID=303371 RepID=A0A835YUC1_9STRA|nr:hypothetical protein JKP88DRAFT_246079 [Tribonema minus]